MNNIKIYILAAIEELFGKIETVEQLVQFCKENNIQGYRYNAASCPLSKLMTERVGFQVQFESNCFSVWQDRKFCVEATQVCADFANRFDFGEFVELDAEIEVA